MGIYWDLIVAYANLIRDIGLSTVHVVLHFRYGIISSNTAAMYHYIRSDPQQHHAAHSRDRILAMCSTVQGIICVKPRTNELALAAL